MFINCARTISCGRPVSEVERLKQNIVKDIKTRWPDLANILNPVSVELLTTKQVEFVDAIENHADYARYRELWPNSTTPTLSNSEKSSAKFDRFVRTAENVILAENLVRIGDASAIDVYQRLIKAESGSLTHGKLIDPPPSN